MNAWPWLVGFSVLSACAPSAAPQQTGNPAVSRPPMAADQISAPKEHRALPAVNPSLESNQAIQQRLDEISERLEYIRRYIGPTK